MDFVKSYVQRAVSSSRSVGPYLLLEVLMPGGTLVALCLFLYRRRQASRVASALLRFRRGATRIIAGARADASPPPATAGLDRIRTRAS